MIKVLVIIIVVYALIILIASIDFDTDNADYLVVLGHRLVGDLLSLTLIMRLDKAVKYLKTNPNTKVILSGGKTKNNNITEAMAMEEYLIQKHISKDRIIKEMYALDTIDNIKYSKELIKDNNSKVVVLSSRYHILRIKMISKMLNFNAKFIAANASPQDSIINLLKEEYLMIDNYLKLKKELNN